MSTKVIKYLNIGLWIILGISLLLIATLVSNSNDAAKLDSSIDTNFFWAYLLLGFAVVAILFSSVVQSFTSGANTKKTLVTVVGLVAVLLLAYMVSSSEMPQFYGVQKLIEGGLTTKVVKLVDAGLYSVYFLAAISIGAMIYSSVSRIWK